MSIYFHILIIYASHLRSDLLALVSNDEADNLSSLMLLIDMILGFQLEPFVSPFDRLVGIEVISSSSLEAVENVFLLFFFDDLRMERILLVNTGKTPPPKKFLKACSTMSE